MRRRMHVRVVVLFCLSLLLSCYGINQLQAEDKAIICFDTGWSGFGNSRALERFNEAKCNFTNHGLTPWKYVCGQDIDYTKKVEPERFLKHHYKLNHLYSNHSQIIARLYAVWASSGISVSMGMCNLTYDQFRELWLENYAKPLIRSFYDNGVYIFDLTQEIRWYDNCYGKGPSGPFREDDTWHPFTTPGAVIYDPDLTAGEFKLKFHDTMLRLYEWKNTNFPKIIFGSSMAVFTTVEDAAKLMMYLKDCIDWMGADVGGYVNVPTNPDKLRGTWDDNYRYSFVPVIEDPSTTSWATAIFESWGWQNGPEIYYGAPGTPYANSHYYSYGVFQDVMDRVVELDGENKYLKLLMNSSWVADFKEHPVYNNPCSILCPANDLGTLPPWIDTPDIPWFYTLKAVYNRWGDTAPHPSDDPAYSSFAYIRDVMHADTNPYWDNSPSTPLVVNREDIVVIPDEDKIFIRVRNLCAPTAISANIHVYQTPQGTTPWDRSTYIKATPVNVKNSLQGAYEIAFIPAGSFSVPGNGNLDTENNVVELEVSSSVSLDNGKDIHVYIEDSDAVKGWTAYNDIPECSNFAIDGDGYYEFDFYPPGISTGNIYIRARAKDIFGACSKYTDALEVEKRYVLNLTCNAFDNDGINEIEYQYSDDGITWHDVPRQKYYCLTANDKEFKQNSRFTPGTTDMGHYPVIESVSGTPLKGVVPLLVNFNVAASDPVGTITSIEWDFDRDGTIDATGADVSWTFTQAGEYNCLVKVTNNETFSSFGEIEVEALDGTPIASITASPRSGSAPLTVQFQGSGTDYDGTIVSYAWDFTSDGVIDSTQQNSSFIYTQIGNYTASLTVTDDSGLIGSAAVSIKVVDPGAVASCTVIASTTEGDVPLTVNFSADISGGTVSSYAWDFTNDGVIDSTEATPSYTYNSSGLYTAKLILTDTTGNEVTDYEYIVVKAVGLPVADFTFSPDGGVAPLEVSFQPAASDPGGQIVSYLWDFGDCTYSNEEVPPPHVYTLNNSYLIRLTITDNDGNEVTIRKTIGVENGWGWKLYGDGNEYKDIAVNQDMLTGGYYTYSIDPDVMGEECGRTGVPIYFRGQDGNIGGNGIANAHGDLTDGCFAYSRDEGVMWSGGMDPEITFDLQGKYALNNIEIWQDPRYDFESVTCYLSQDGISWGEIGIFNSDGLKRVHIDLRNHSARKIKLSFENSDSHAYLAEIQIWGTPFEESLMDWVDEFKYSGSPEDYGWQINNGSGTLSTEYDDFLKSNVMRVDSPDGWNFRLIRKPTDDPEASYADLEKRYLSYTIKSGELVWVYVLVRAEDNQGYYLIYRPFDFNKNDGYVSGNNVYYSLSEVYEGNQNWNTISRDLEKDLFTATGKHLKNVAWVRINGGDYCLDDLTFSSSAPSTLGWSLIKDSVITSNGSMLKVMDYELGHEIIKVQSDDHGQFGIRTIKTSSDDWTNKRWVHFKIKTFVLGIQFRILVMGTDDQGYYLSYLTDTGDMHVGDAWGRTVYHYLGSDTRNGEWVDVYRDIYRDLYAAFGVYPKEILSLMVRGGGYYMDVVELSDEPFNKIEIPLNYGWGITGGEGTVEYSVDDPDLQSQVMKITSNDGWDFRIIGPEVSAGYLEASARYLSFMIRASELVWVEVLVRGEDDLDYTLIYRTGEGEPVASGSRYYYYLGSDLENDKWHYIMRDLDKDLNDGMGVNVKDVRCFVIKGGNYSLDNLSLYKDAPSGISVPLSAADWYSYEGGAYIGDGEFTNDYSFETGSQVLQIISASGENWYCLSRYPKLGYLDITKKYVKLNVKTTGLGGAGLAFHVQGLDGQYYQITYITDDGVDRIYGEGTAVYIYLGSQYKDNWWHEIWLDLENDLYEKFGQHLGKTMLIGIHGGNVEISKFEFMDKVGLLQKGNLVGCWQFDEGSGTIAEDSSGRGNNGMIEGAQWVDGKGKALSFDGVDDYVEIENDESLNFGPGVDFSISAWIKTPSDGNIKVIYAGRTGGATDVGWWMSVRGDRNRLAFELCDGSALRIQLFSSDNAIPDDEWVHVTVTADRDDLAKVYINGIFNNSVSISTQDGDLSNALNKRIGATLTGDAPFNGIIDEVRIY
ncbi:MAG: PKD domain-containing protein [bacterium]